MAAAPVRLLSPLPLADCRARLAAVLDAPWRLRRTAPVHGRLRGDRLWAFKRIGYRNSFQTRLVAQLSADGTGTALDCRFGLHPFVTVFMVVWFGGLLTGTGGLVVASLRGEATATSGADALAAVVPVGMALFGIGLPWVGRWVARDERRFLLAWLAETVEARAERG